MLNTLRHFLGRKRRRISCLDRPRHRPVSDVRRLLAIALTAQPGLLLIGPTRLGKTQLLRQRLGTVHVHVQSVSEVQRFVDRWIATYNATRDPKVQAESRANSSRGEDRA